MSSYEKTKMIPVIESDVFKEHESARFAIGTIAIGSEIVANRTSEFYGAADLRARVYVNKGFVKPSELDEKGTELDENDERSVHFAILERIASVDSLARVVGNMRLIVKSYANDDALPVEYYYPEVFRGRAPIGSTEVSRLICRHEDSTVQAALKWPLFIAGLKYVDKNNLGPVYGLLEPALASSLVMQRVPVAQLAAAKYVPAINATKQPVEIDVSRLKDVVDSIGDHDVRRDGGFSHINFPGNAPTLAQIEEAI